MDVEEKESPVPYIRYKQCGTLFDTTKRTVNEKRYIDALMDLYDDANEATIKVWTTEPSYSAMIRNAKLVRQSGYDVLYYTCTIGNREYVPKVEVKYGIRIRDRNDAINKCVEEGRLDILKIIESGI